MTALRRFEKKSIFARSKSNRNPIQLIIKNKSDEKTIQITAAVAAWRSTVCVLGL
jgi:hypothetical protein